MKFIFCIHFILLPIYICKHFYKSVVTRGFLNKTTCQYIFNKLQLRHELPVKNNSNKRVLKYLKSTSFFYRGCSVKKYLLLICKFILNCKVRYLRTNGLDLFLYGTELHLLKLKKYIFQYRD